MSSSRTAMERVGFVDHVNVEVDGVRKLTPAFAQLRRVRAAL